MHPVARATIESRARGLDPLIGVPLALLLHVAAFFLAASIEPDEPEQLDLVEFEVAELPPAPEPEPPKPEVEPEPEPPPEPEVKPLEPEVTPPPEVKPKPKPKAKPEPTPPPTPETPPPSGPPKPARLELDLPLTPGGNGPVTVKPGTGGGTSGSGNGTPGGNGTKPGSGGTGSSGKGTGNAAGPPWQPKNDLFIRQQPRVIKVPELECPAVAQRQVSGTVVLLVQVTRDGKVRSAKVTKPMGSGCDDIAKKALKQSKFAPAVGTDGQPADYELRYEYVFELQD
ncbi:MAG: TonB family protein [Deltaproteobacteria bacterium]|nr:TonB family protein [Deltaproteobacteria bacterium]